MANVEFNASTVLSPMNLPALAFGKLLMIGGVVIS
jgi:hypothetical protein